MKLKTFPVFNSYFSFIIDNKLRAVIENMEKNVKIMGVKQGMRVLEVGCGSGFVTPYLSKVVAGEGFIISIDVQENMINKAKKKKGYLKNVDFRVESASNLKSIKDEEIDLVFLYYSFHEIKNKGEAIREFYRALKPNGMLSIKEPKFEVLRKDRQLYKEFIANEGFRLVNDTENCDFLGCYLEFVKK